MDTDPRQSGDGEMQPGTLRRRCDELEYELMSLRSLLARAEETARARTDSATWRVGVAARGVARLLLYCTMILPAWQRLGRRRRSRALLAVPTLTEMFHLRSLALRVPTNLTPCNPSIVATETGWLACVRTHNYRILPNGLFRYSFVSESWNEIWLIEIDDNFSVETTSRLRPRFSVVGVSLMDPARNGLQDCRLFAAPDGIRILATAANAQTGTNVMVTGRLMRDELVDLQFIRSPKGQVREKNWMPIMDSAQASAIYSVSPLCVVTLDQRSRILHERLTSSDLDDYCGSSQAIRYEAGWLAVIHKRISNRTDAWYLHRLLHCSCDWNIVRTSPDFFFEQRGIEFCAGLANKGDRFVFSYGVDDRQAKILEIDRDQLESLLR